MLRLNSFTLFAFSCGLLLSGCQNQKMPAVENVTTTVLATSVPTAREIVLVPTGYSTCFTVKDAIYTHKFIQGHRVCQYDHANGQMTWVDGYWECPKFEKKVDGGVCYHWKWHSAYWAKSSQID